jgi:hypothetical protein
MMFEGVYCGGSTAKVDLIIGLSLSAAKDKLLSFYVEERQNDQRGSYRSWATIIRHDNEAWNLDGLFGFEEDGYYYNIEIE